jgi:hypothetical protein
MTMDRELVEMLKAAGYRVGSGSEQEARAGGDDFWLGEDGEYAALTVEAEEIMELAISLAEVIALKLLQQGLAAETPSACCH